MSFKLSTKGAAFIEKHEGTVTRAYRDPVGIVTIGTGYTNRSREFLAYWKAKYGRPMQMGDTITRTESLRILPIIADEEYGAAVNRHIKPQKQHEYDGATSVCFNLGPGAATWRWAKELAARNVRRAAEILANNYNTAGGRVLRGLTRRRQEEARLIEHGDYGAVTAPARPRIVPDDNLKTYQQHLKTLGHDPGPIDGLWGARTESAVLAFQKTHPDLVNDGILGPATRAQIDRAIAARNGGQIVGGGILVTGVTTVATRATDDPSMWSWVGFGLGGIVLIGAIILFVRYWPELRNMIDKREKS